MAAEKQLIDLYKDKDTKVLNTKLANMEKDKQLAIKNGDLALAGKLANQQTQRWSCGPRPWAWAHGLGLVDLAPWTRAHGFGPWACPCACFILSYII